MLKSVEIKKYKIDAAGRAIGRVASQAAAILRGKNLKNFAPNIDFGNLVTIENVSRVKITGNKMEGKKYYHHSGYPGGLKVKLMKELELTEVMKRAVWRMLPNNKLRDKMIKRLAIKK